MSEQPNLAADPELLAGFFDETQETLGTLDALFIRLESTPDDLSIIEGIFRPIHSLKGNSAFFGFMEAKRLAHEMETLLDHVRKGRMKAERAVIDALLTGTDTLKALFTRLRAGEVEVDDAAAFTTVISRVTTLSGGSSAPAAPDSNQRLQDLDTIAAALGATAGPGVLEALGRLRQCCAGGSKTISVTATSATPVAAIKAILASPFDGTLDTEKARLVLTELEKLRHQARDDAAKGLAAEMLDAYHAFVDAMGFDTMLRDFILERLPKVEAMAFGDAAPVAVKPAGEALEPKSDRHEKNEKSERREKSERIDGQKTMRVAEATIDTFLHYVGELLVVGDLFGHLYRRVGTLPNAAPMARDFRRANETFATLSNKLQKSIMAIRRVPIRPLLQKVPRLARDVAGKQGKDVQVVLVGEDVQVDKSLIELLDAPMTHMVRNSADHGIELPEVRERAGKPRIGTVTITAAESDAWLTLTIADDGAGLNLDAIRRKGENLGLIAPGAMLTEHDVVNLIFASGVSTAAAVTDISGRGVGMDVVKRAVEDAGGVISVDSQPGKGSTFQIRLPKGVTTQILPGYLVQVAGRTYAMPLDRIHETFQAQASEMNSVIGKGACLKRHDVVLPVLSLSEILTGTAAPWPKKGATLVTVMANRRKIALVVEAVLGVQKVVIRPMTGLPAGADMIAGGALMGNGTVALILNLDRLQEGM